MRIIGPNSATFAKVKANIAASGKAHPRFIDEMLTPLWVASHKYGIDAVGVVAQALKETGWGHYGGAVKPEFYNTCGLKIRHTAMFPGVTDGDNPLAHQIFPNWEVGAEAHLQHLRAYAGWALALDTLLVDGRYGYVYGKYRLENFADLGGKWAPSPTYGTELEALARTLSV